VGVKDLSLEVYLKPAGSLMLPGVSPWDEFCFRNGKGDVAQGCSLTEGGKAFWRRWTFVL